MSSIIEPHDAGAELTMGSIGKKEHATFHPGRWKSIDATIFVILA